MTEKKKLPVVQGRRKIENKATIYTPTGFNFAWISSPETGRHQASGITSCRERLALAAFLSRAKHKLGQDFNSYSGIFNTVDDAPVDFEKFRLLLVGERKEAKARLFNAKKCLNCFEEYAGWQKSTISTVKHQRYKDTWMVVGPKEWMKYPQGISIAGLILRVCYRFNVEATDTVEGIISQFKKLLSKVNIDNSDSYDIGTFISKSYDKMHIFIKNMDAVFSDIDEEVVWGKGYVELTDPNTFSIRSGFNTFLTGKCDYSQKIEKARNKFHEIYEKEKTK